MLIAMGWMVLLGWLLVRVKPERLVGPKWQFSIIVLLMATTLAVFFRFLLPLEGYLNTFPIDDSYITLTAARNFAVNNILGVNPEQPLSAVTSPLHVLLTGLLGKLISVEIASRVIGLIAFLLLVAGVFVWAQQLEKSLIGSAGAAAVVALCGPMAFGSLNGLETVPFAALLVWSFFAFERSLENPRKFYLMGVLVGLAILTRPEGWFLALSLYGIGFVRLVIYDRAKLWHFIMSGLVALAVVAPYLIANHIYTGEFFPVTVSAKKYFFSDNCRPLIQRIIIVLTSTPLALGPFILLLPLLIWSKVFVRRVYPLLYVVIFYSAYTSQFPGALLHYWGRYQHPLLPFMMVGIVLGAVNLYRIMLDSERWARVVICGFLMIFLSFGAGIAGTMEVGIYRNALVANQSFLMSITDWIHDNSEPGDLVATHDIGALYYFSERPVLDLVGLADREVAELYKNSPPLCEDNTERRRKLYQLVKSRRPRIIYFAPKWEEWFLSLVKSDNGVHMQKATSLSHDYQLDGDDKVQIYAYDFYLCDWERNLRHEQP